jgi:restriction endonuclease
MTENKINEFKDILEKAKTAKTKAETQLEQLNEEEKKLLEQMKEMGVTPETIEEKIKNLDQEIEKTVTDCETLVKELKEVI